jgi:hypothetical protein
LKKELQASTEAGSFSDWMYFDRGRLSLAARPWSPALQLALDKEKEKEKEKESAEAKKKEQSEEKKEEAKPEEKKSDKKSAEKPAEEDKRNEEDRAFLKWIDEHAKDAFVPWTHFDHPDLKGKEVEIGGFAPFAKSNPPEPRLADLSTRHGAFLTQLVQKLPRVGVRATEIKNLGKSVYDLTIRIENSGYLPTAIAQGSTSREVRRTRLTLQVPGTALLAGNRITQFDPIPGSGGSKEAHFVLYLPNTRSLDLEVASELGGTVKTTVQLPE